jgi:predicted Zn-dependent protease
MVNAPPSIPQGPITMNSFNRPAPPPSIPQAPPSIPQQPPMQQPLQQQAMPPMQQAQAPPSIPQQMPSYPVRKPAAGNPKTQPARPVAPAYNQAAPYNQASAMPAVPEQPQIPMSAEMAEALRSMPYDKKAGDYTAQVTKLGGSFARWTNVPVRVHIPMNTPDNWKIAIDAAVRKWGEYLPTTIAPASEPADIEIGWINHLMPRQLGITNLEIFNGRPRVTIYLLRPNYYPPDVNEKVLQQVATHEIGHALGIYGHSTTPGDMMYAMDGKGGGKATTLSPRDINTLRKIYESAPLPEGFQSPQPISWP